MIKYIDETNFKTEVLELLDDIETAITEQKYELILEDIKEFRQYIYAVTKIEASNDQIENASKI